MSVFTGKNLNNAQLVWLIFIGSLIPTLYFSATGSPLAAAVPAFVALLVVLNLRTDQLFDLLFWSSFLILFLGNRLIQKYIFSIDALGIKNQLYWGVDMLTFLILFRMLLMNRYKNRVLIFVVVMAIIFGVTSFVNGVSPVRALLAFRSNYIFLPMIFLMVIYDFKLSYYRKYFRLFVILALVNSALSAVSMLHYGIYVSGDGNGGIFGSNGTGIGLLFVAAMATLFLQIYFARRKQSDLVFMLFTIMFIVTGKGFFGFPLMIASVLTLFMLRIKNRDKMRKIFVTAVGTISLIALSSFLIPKEQSERVIQRFTNIDALIAYDQAGGHMGRIGSVAYGFRKVTESLPSALLGYGPGTISYKGATSGIRNTFLETSGTQWVMPSLAYLYEFGFVGVVLFTWLFIYFFGKWRQIRIWPEGLERFYLQNVPSVLMIYYLCIFYTSAFKIYFLVFFLAIQLGFLRQWLDRQPKIEEKLGNGNTAG